MFTKITVKLSLKVDNDHRLQLSKGLYYVPYVFLRIIYINKNVDHFETYNT